MEAKLLMILLRDRPTASPLGIMDMWIQQLCSNSSIHSPIRFWMRIRLRI